MNISSWPLGKIMQLPDHCFGERYPISCNINTASAANLFTRSPLAFPDRCVIWSFFLYGISSNSTLNTVRFRLGDHVPTTEAQFVAFQSFLAGGALPFDSAEGYEMSFSLTLQSIPMKKLLITSGKRLVMHVENSGAVAKQVLGGVVISRIPTEIPDCFL